MSLQTEIAEKRQILRSLYGGKMTKTQLREELGLSWEATSKWAAEKGVARKIGRWVSYDTDAVAKALVIEREFM